MIKPAPSHYFNASLKLVLVRRTLRRFDNQLDAITFQHRVFTKATRAFIPTDLAERKATDQTFFLNRNLTMMDW